MHASTLTTGQIAASSEIFKFYGSKDSAHGRQKIFGPGVQKIDFFKKARNWWGIKRKVRRAKMKAQGPSNCWIWSGGLAARPGWDVTRLSEKNGSFRGQKIDFFKISWNWWGIKGKVRRAKMKAQGPSNCWIWSGVAGCTVGPGYGPT